MRENKQRRHGTLPLLASREILSCPLPRADYASNQQYLRYRAYMETSSVESVL